MDKLELKPHQIIPIKFLKNHRALILYHTTGSGKTITALKCMLQFKRDIIVIGPKSSEKAFHDDAVKFGLDEQRIKFYSFQKIKLLLEDNLDIMNDCCVIVDEAHNLRNETTNNLTVITALGMAYRILLLTATPVINYPNDLAVLINIVNGEDVMPTDPSIFNNMYYNEEEVRLINTDILAKKLNNAISYHRTITRNSDFPSSETIFREVEMNQIQLEQYAEYIKKYLYDKDVVRINPTVTEIYNVDFSLFNRKKKNFFLSATRQLSNTVDGNPDFPKITQIMDVIRKGPFPAVVYSNYLKNGIHALAIWFEKENIRYKTITGSTNSAKLSNVVERYNNGDFDVLLISSAGSESLDLKNTRQIHIMEPHWNESRIQQVIGRSIRYRSHSKLPKEERNVMIYRWISIFPDPIINISADQHLVELSKKKQEMFKLYDQLIIDHSIENDNSIKKNQSGGYIVENMNKLMYNLNKLMYNQLIHNM